MSSDEPWRNQGRRRAERAFQAAQRSQPPGDRMGSRPPARRRDPPGESASPPCGRGEQGNHADQGYQARTTIQYLEDLLARGWNPSEQREHVGIIIGNPLPVPGAPPVARKPWWRFW